MKKTFNDIFSKLEYCSHIPDQYYGHILTLSGMVYEKSVDSEIDQDLKQLSKAYESMKNSTLGKIKDIVHEIVFWTKPERENRIPDVEHLLHEHKNANLDQINALIANLAQLYGNRNAEQNEQYRHGRIAVDFSPLISGLQKLIDELPPAELYDFNLPIIIGWIKKKGVEKGFINEKVEDD